LLLLWVAPEGMHKKEGEKKLPLKLEKTKSLDAI
jgi:hypothetical protein